MDEKRFEIIYKQGVSLSTEVRILRDKVTGVHYLINWTGQGLSLIHIYKPIRQALEEVNFLNPLVENGGLW